MTKHLRGDSFVNRYRITGTLTSRSPLHIGSGFCEPGEPNEQGEATKVNLIARDFRGLPYIPGSALKGVMRHWLLHVLGGLAGNWADTNSYSNDELDDNGNIQDQQLEKVRSSFSWLELLFGTPWHAGKIDVWDCPCITTVQSANDALTNWSPDRLTYQETSVAIDPETGTAAEHLLYTSEVVPEGISFQVSICGQNLDDLEIGMLLLALQAFNSEIYPLSLGAKAGRGYGRMSYARDAIHRLSTDQVDAWVTKTIASYGQPPQDQPDAGFYGLDRLEQEQEQALLKDALGAFVSELGERNG